jgi:hypothetical protein
LGRHSVAAVQYKFTHKHPVAVVQYKFTHKHPVAAVQYTFTHKYPVSAVQYTFTHKQYTEYRERNIHNNKKIWEVQCVPRLCELYPGICLATEEKARKNFRLELILRLS